MNIFNQTITITKEAIDINLHVNNVMYIQWMQDVAMAHSQEVGDTFEVQKQRSFMWVVKSHSIEYLHSAYEGEDIHVKTWCEKYKKSASIRGYEFTNKKGQILARAKTIYVCLNSLTLRPMKIPEDIDSLYY